MRLPPRIAVLVITRERSVALLRALDSVARAAARAPRAEVRAHVGINGPDPRTRAALAGRTESAYAWSDPLPPGAARNRLVARAGLARDDEAEMDWIVFLDDDAELDAGFFERLLERSAETPTVAVWGGPNVGPPGEAARWAWVAEAALRTRLGSGRSLARYVPGPLRLDCGDEALILCALAVRAPWFRAHPFREPALTCAEENEWIGRLRAAGATCAYDPGLRSFHARRATPGAILRQIHKYGVGRGELTRLRPASAGWTHLAPPLALAALLLALPVAPAAAAATLAILWLALVLPSALVGAFRVRRGEVILPLCLLFPLWHLAYALGFWRGAGRRPALARPVPLAPGVVP